MENEKDEKTPHLDAHPFTWMKSLKLKEIRNQNSKN
jgi:hypothetical protein